MDDQKKQLIDKLKSTNNILVTVRNSPNVDELSACIGLTLLLNKYGKHATAVFSGEVPSVIDFLKPEETLEKNTDSLRDFIIALDKSKADKLRYKVEDKVVKIFITPYRTSISQDDLEFSQGDFNVDAVVALGAHEQNELDTAITEHNRILHDAVMMSINTTDNGNFGSINWVDTRASSLCELVARINRSLGSKDKNLLDEQIATALLTGIVAETERFSNARTTPDTMSISSELMAAGANQQLVASELEAEQDESLPPPSSDDGSGEAGRQSRDTPSKADDGTLEISHDQPDQLQPRDLPPPAPEQADRVAFGGEHIDGLPQLGPAKATGDSLVPPQSEPPRIRQLHDPNSMLPNVPESVPSEVRDITGIPAPDSEVPSGMPPAGPASFFTPKPMEPPQPGPRPLLSHDGPPATSDQTPQQAPVEASAPPPPMNLPPPADLPPPPPSPKFEPYASKPEPEPEPKPQPEPEPLPAPTPPAAPPPPSPAPPSAAPPSAPATAPKDPADDGPTLAEIERSVQSAHADDSPSEPSVVSDVDSARSEVLKALEEATNQPLEPISALNAQPLGGELHPGPATPPEAPAAENASSELQIDADGNIQTPSTSPAFAPPAIPNIANEPAPSSYSPADQPLDMPLPPGIHVPPPQTAPPTNQPGGRPDSPPPVPPPMMPMP
jgi:hypothetical protein